MIHQIVGDDKEKAKKLESFTLEQLEFQKELMTGDTTPNGLTSSQTDGVPMDDGNIPTPSDDGNEMSKDEVIAFYEQEFGEKPSFINE